MTEEHKGLVERLPRPFNDGYVLAFFSSVAATTALAVEKYIEWSNDPSSPANYVKDSILMDSLNNLGPYAGPVVAGGALLVAGAVKYRRELASGLNKIDQALGCGFDYVFSKPKKGNYDSINQKLNAKTALNVD